MEDSHSAVANYFAQEREQVTGQLERRAKELEQQAAALRTDSLNAWEQTLGEQADVLRQKGAYSGIAQQALLHYFGGDLQEEVLGPLSRGGAVDDHWTSFLEFAQRLESYEGQVPVVINSPQYVLYRDGSSEWREYVFALVDSGSPFYANRVIFDADGKILKPTDDDSATRELKSFGLNGNFTAVNTSEDERTIGGIEGDHTYVSGGDAELIIADDPNYRGRGTRSMYLDKNRYTNKIVTNSSMNVEYALGWQEIEELIYAENAGERRNQAARKIGKYLLPSSIEPEEVMPKAGVLIQAVRALDVASYS